MKLINFFTNKEKYLNLGLPKPIKSMIPDWYKAAENSYISSESLESGEGLKTCMPYLDALISGYALVTPMDIYVSKDEQGALKLSWDSVSDLSDFIMERPKELGATMPRPDGYHPNHLVWRGFWGVKTPKKYSILMTHPLNRDDLPFRTTSGIVDSDNFSASGNIPFFIKAGFEGTIPAGTPFCQIIPIKRDRWKMINNQGMSDLEIKHGTSVRKEGQSYKKKMWVRKEYF